MVFYFRNAGAEQIRWQKNRQNHYHWFNLFVGSFQFRLQSKHYIFIEFKKSRSWRRVIFIRWSVDDSKSVKFYVGFNVENKKPNQQKVPVKKYHHFCSTFNFFFIASSFIQ